MILFKNLKFKIILQPQRHAQCFTEISREDFEKENLSLISIFFSNFGYELCSIYSTLRNSLIKSLFSISFNAFFSNAFILPSQYG